MTLETWQMLWFYFQSIKFHSNDNSQFADLSESKGQESFRLFHSFQRPLRFCGDPLGTEHWHLGVSHIPVYTTRAALWFKGHVRAWPETCWVFPCCSAQTLRQEWTKFPMYFPSSFSSCAILWVYRPVSVMKRHRSCGWSVGVTIGGGAPVLPPRPTRRHRVLLSLCSE